MKLLRTLMIALVMLLAIGGTWVWSGNDDDPAAAQMATTWQVETDIWKDDLAAFITTIDTACDIEIESQGVSAYIVAYRCPE